MVAPEICVYVIRNTANGRGYVGSSIALDRRWRDHRRQLAGGRHHNRALQQDFEWTIIGRAHSIRAMVGLEAAHLKAETQPYNTRPWAGSSITLWKRARYGDEAA